MNENTIIAELETRVAELEKRLAASQGKTQAEIKAEQMMERWREILQERSKDQPEAREPLPRIIYVPYPAYPPNWSWPSIWPTYPEIIC